MKYWLRLLVVNQHMTYCNDCIILCHGAKYANIYLNLLQIMTNFISSIMRSCMLAYDEDLESVFLREAVLMGCCFGHCCLYCFSSAVIS
jgi:hypothetical protein